MSWIVTCKKWAGENQCRTQPGGDGMGQWERLWYPGREKASLGSSLGAEMGFSHLLAVSLLGSEQGSEVSGGTELA